MVVRELGPPVLMVIKGNKSSSLDEQDDCFTSYRLIGFENMLQEQVCGKQFLEKTRES